MKDEEGNRFYSCKEKCHPMEKAWRDVFRITEEEEFKFDLDHADHVNIYINIQHQKISPFSTTLLSRLNNGSFYNRGIEKQILKGTEKVPERKHRGLPK